MDQDLKQQLDRMEKFLLEHVVTKEELLENNKRLKEELATKESVNILTSAVDKFAKTVRDFEAEHLSIKSQMLRMQGWIRNSADKIGVEFKL